MLYVPGRPDLLAWLGHAIAHRAAAGAAGLDPVPAELVPAPPRFLAGEESALVSRVSGGPARPRFKRPPVYQQGIGGRPTLVQNVETLAHLALIARRGAAWFRAAGTPDEPGSMLCTVRHPDGSTRVIEAGIGTPLADLLPGLSAPAGHGGIQAVLCGGYHGGWLTPGRAAGLTLSNTALRPAGAFAGAGILAALPAGRCGLAETARVARYLALESAGQCGPCLNGPPRIAAALGELAVPQPAPGCLEAVRRWSGLVAGRGACHHPDGFTRFAASALTVFAAELGAHASGRCAGRAGQVAFLPVPAPAAGEEGWR
ncbi:MAG TPA: NADH-ubiquinone oxidoreductase-F iron-sulfur binding region domain-containing protein [Streptosporangiaceae bacterium]